VTIRVAGAADAAALASLRGDDDPEFVTRIAAWLASEGNRRTTWLALVAEEPVGMASMLEYRRMPRPDRPDSRWGYVSNMFVREQARDRGIGTALLETIIATAEERGYARLVLSPSARSMPLYERAGFVVPDEAAGEHRLLVRPR
jgi:GNAT superfamily N-acetyltransferase